LTNIDGTVWVWSSGTGNYLYRNSQSMGNLVDGIIPVSQAFFIKAHAPNPVLTIPEDARVHSVHQFYAPAREDANIPLIVMEVIKDQKKDEVWVTFCESCSDDYDNGYDVNKKFGDIYSPQFYMKEGNLSLSINALPDLSDEGKTIPLEFIPGENGQYKINLINLTGLDGKEIVLEDKLTESFHVISEEPSYSFWSNIDDSPDRFLLHIGKTITGIKDPAESISDYNIYSFNKIVHIQRSGVAESQNIKVQLIDIYGRILSEKSFGPSIENFIKTNLNNSVVIVKVLDDNGKVITEKVLIR
jgi:hypothetical protein